MKRNLIYIIGIVLVLLLIGVWGFLLIFGTPVNSNAIFADFGMGSTDEIERAPLPVGTTSEQEITVDLSTSHAQLTTRPVAGYVFLPATASSTPRIRYVEQGIGHVYELDLVSGLETRVLGKSFTGITNAVLAPDGEVIVLIAESGTDRTVYLEVMNSEETHTLPADAANIAFLSSSDVRYTRTEENQLSGYAYDVLDMESVKLFSVPFTQASVVWKLSGTWVYTKPAPFLRGALYRILNGTVARIDEARYGLSALINDTGTVVALTYGNTKANQLTTHVLVGGETYPVTFPMIPEKCAIDESSIDPIAGCGGPALLPARTYMNEWYRGSISPSDSLWRVDMLKDTTTRVANFTLETGRSIDVTDVAVYEDGAYTFFRNKVDGALWLFRNQEAEVTPDASNETASTVSDGDE